MATDIAESLIIKKPIYREPVPSNTLNNTERKITDKDEYYKMDPKLQLHDVIDIVKSQFVKNYKEIIKALQTFDIEGSGLVTKGELRRVLDSYCLPMTTNQYDKFLSHNSMNTPNGSINYNDLTEKINGNNCLSVPNYDKNFKLPQLQRSATTLCLPNTHFKQPMGLRSSVTATRSQLCSQSSSRSSTSRQSSRSWNYNAYSIDEIIPILQMRITKNPNAIMKAFKLFDFNSDNCIQRHRLKKVLENFCCSLTDQQFDKLLVRFSHSQNGNVNYLDLMKSIGIPIDSQGIIQFIKKSNKVNIDTRNIHDAKIPESALIENGLLGSAELEELLIIFRKKVEDQFSALRKAFLVMDPNAEGTVTLCTLHQMLNQFVFPMSTNVFKQIMEKCAFKATGTIVWLKFLQKFQDPQSKHLNGSTVTIKSDHKCNPIQGVNAQSNLDELLELLSKHVSNNYISFRDAFLQINKTHKGKIPKSEFIKILNRFQFHISPEQLNLILTFLDPNNRGFISYHHFLELFEQKENLSAHKWLNSNHKVFEPRKDLQLSSETIISTLHDNITNKWSQVVQEFKSVDLNRSGFISIGDLKKIFSKLFGYLKDEDIDRLVAPLSLKDKRGRINYLELFNLLNIDTSPTDLDGLSTQISDANDAQLKERHEDHMGKMDAIDKIGEARVNLMSCAELAIRMKDRMLQNRSNYFELYKRYECSDKQGGISKNQFKKMLNEFGYCLTNEQFDNLCEAINFPVSSKSRIDFNGFMTIFMDNRQSSNDLNNSLCFLPKSNHHVNDIRGEDNRKMNSQEIEELLRQKIVNNFSDLMVAFHKFDVKNKGYLTKSDFRNFLLTFLMVIDEVQFGSLCEKLEIGDKSKLTYNDFLDRFQIRDNMVDGHKWLESKHRFNDPINNTVPDLTAEEVYILLPEKIHQHFNEITPTFIHLVTNGTGFIRFKNLQQLLIKLQINMAKSEMKKLWKKYDIHNRNKLDYHDFLNNMGLLEKFNVGDLKGPSAVIIQNSHETLIDHLANQEIKHQQSVDNQAILGSHLHVEHLFEMVKRHLRVTYSDTNSAFKAVANKKSLTGYFTLNDLNKLMSQLHLFVTNEKFVQLAARMGFDGPDDSLSYEKFCSIFQDTVNMGGQEKPVNSVKINCDLERPSKIVVEEAGHLNITQIISVISKKITDQYSEIEKTFLVMDPENTGNVTINEFRNLISGFCLSLTDKQFSKYLNSLSTYIVKNNDNNEKFDYRYFMKSFSQKETDIILANLEVPSMSAAPLNTSNMSFQRIQEYITESVKVRPKLFFNSFKYKDYANLNFISKSDFREVLEQYIFKLSNSDFDKFWLSLNRNEFDNINYVEFIKNVSGYSEVENDKRLKSPPAVKEKHKENSNDPEIGEEDSDELMRKTLEKILNKNWQNIFNKCKTLDQSINETQTVEGSILIDDFIYILSEYDNSLSTEKLASLNLYKTCRNGRLIRYGDLIRSVVLSSRGSLITHENAADILKKFKAVGIKTTNSDNTKDYFPQLFKLRRQILENWKDLRKHFALCDKKQQGTVSGTIFMTTMKTICGQLNVDLFYHLMKIYDYDGTGNFNYKRFIEEFLKTA